MSHIGPIVFSDETARAQLVEHGEVITFRPSDRTTGKTWWRKSRTGEKEGDVLVERHCEIDPTDAKGLSVYQPLSGFETTTDWQDAIRGLHGDMPDSGYLYRVTKR